MLASAFSLFGTTVTWLEVVAFSTALGCIICNVAEIHWGWPLAMVSSALYGWLFSASRLYGEAAIQGFFVATAMWGWWQWLFGTRGTRASARTDPAVVGPRTLTIAHLPPRAIWPWLLWLLGWPLLAVLLACFTDTDVPILDAFATAGSVVGQILTARKYIESWAVWIIVNVFSVGLFAYKALWLTVLLYAVFVGLAIAGHVRWRRRLRAIV